jgi:NAD-dependent DNA ligase
VSSSFDREDAARSGRFAGSYMIDAAYAQLIGLCRGVLADSQLNDAEIVALDQWLETYGAHLPEWPAQALVRHVKDILRDGEVDEEERQELFDFLSRATGGEGGQQFDASTTLPLTRPEPHIEYEGRRFCLTGTFVYGPRRKVSTAISEWGGTITETPGKSDYLIIGATIALAWKYCTHGRKIEDAVALRESGHRIAIVSEAHWSATLC